MTEIVEEAEDLDLSLSIHHEETPLLNLISPLQLSPKGGEMVSTMAESKPRKV